MPALGESVLSPVTSKVGLRNDRLTEGLVGSCKPSAPTIRVNKKPSPTLGEDSLEGADLISSLFYIKSEREPYTVSLMVSETAPIDISFIRKVSRSLRENPILIFAVLSFSFLLKFP